MHVSTKLTILYIAILVIVLFFLHSRIKEKYKTYCELIIICIVLTFSMTGQSELFNRMEFVLIPVVIPVIQELVSEFSGFRFLSAKARLKGARCYQLGMAFSLWRSIWFRAGADGIFLLHRPFDAVLRGVDCHRRI